MQRFFVIAGTGGVLGAPLAAEILPPHMVLGIMGVAAAIGGIGFILPSVPRRRPSAW